MRRQDDGTCGPRVESPHQCVTGKCAEGLYCSEWFQCMKCKTIGDVCISDFYGEEVENQCCGDTTCETKGSTQQEKICKKCVPDGSSCYLEDYNFCCGRHSNCIDNKCKKCQLTGDQCSKDADCCWDTDRCLAFNDTTKCMKTHALKDHHYCANSYQNCRPNDPEICGQTIECCDGTACNEIGFCDCINQNSQLTCTKDATCCGSCTCKEGKCVPNHESGSCYS